MNETSAKEIKTLDGYAFADVKARTDIEKLAEEIAPLLGGTTTVTETGIVVAVDVAEGTELNVSGDTTAAVKLVHHGKNFMPLPRETQLGEENGVTWSINDDGSVSVVGVTTGDSNCYWADAYSEGKGYLPAGTYCVSATLKHGAMYATLRASDVAGSGYEKICGLTYSIPSAVFTIDSPKYITFVCGSSGLNRTLNEKIYVQLERGEKPTAFEKHNGTMQNIALPVTLNAKRGVNIVYTNSGNELAVSYEKVGGEKEDVAKLIADAMRFDPTPYTLPILYLDGNTAGMDKDNAVTLSYKWGERTGTLTCKWQGNSSLTFPKKNYTLKFDEAFEVVEGWGAQKKYCVKANHNDFTQSRNVVSAKIWGRIVNIRTPANPTLAACPNFGAVDGFPIVIVLNGEFHGIYCWNIPKDPWMMDMGNGAHECILCAELHVPQTEFRQGGALLDGSDFELEYITNEDDISWAVTSVNNLLTACGNSDGTDLDTTIAAMLDWESAIDYYIYSVLLRHVDGVSKNYLLSTYDGTKWFFTAYDMDTVFGNVWNGAEYEPPTAGGTFATMAAGNHLFDLIRTYKKDALKARYARLRNGVLSESNISAMFIRFAGPISRTLLDEENRAWPMTPYTSVHTIDSILNWYRLRCQYIDAEVAAM